MSDPRHNAAPTSAGSKRSATRSPSNPPLDHHSPSPTGSTHRPAGGPVRPSPAHFRISAENKGGIGFCPNLATCDNTDDLLVIDPRAGNATANCAADNIALLDQAVARLPGRFRHRMLVRLDGAGFSHQLLDHIAAAGGKRGRRWEFSVGWSCTDTEMDAIAILPPNVWEPGIDQHGQPVPDTFVAELTGLLDLTRWPAGTRIVVRDEPLHPRYRG